MGKLEFQEKVKSTVKTLTLKDFPAEEECLASVHLLADFMAPKNNIEDTEEIEKLLFEAALAANNTPIKTIVHKFPVQGVTGVILLAESHIAIHTWPEHDYISIDIFTCGKNTQPYQALEYLKNKFSPRQVRIKEVIRSSS
ncbi:MAG: adenosylmethionine decarboxylase [Candidatus Omnitrophica bacterium]|nr:adenosylmethionine decarboxylase [Candidatus Omnitrophota bacterium]